MAERFGGRYSPGGGRGEAPAPAPSPRGRRVTLLFLAPLPLVLGAFFRDATGLAQNLAAFGLLIGAAFLTREGLAAEAAYHARRVARRPAIPRKLLGAGLTALGLAVAGWQSDTLTGTSWLNPAIFACLGAVLHVFAFGADPLRDKGAEGVDSFQSGRVARAVEEAEKHLGAMSEAISRAGDRALERRVAAFQSTVRTMLRSVEEDPRDLTGARKYLSVYLQGARDATVKFADLYARTGDAEARAKYAALLDDLEANFSARTEKLLTDNRSDLDIEIEVLRDRLAREGVRPAGDNRGS
jgi:hypothetical protein